jgi:hypothetical protein
MSATIAARAHSHATISGPARRGQSARRKASWFARFWRLVWRRPGRSLILFIFSAVAAAILLNALMFQKARHPAPIIAAPAASAPAPARNVERRAEQAPAAVVPESSPPALLPPSRPGDLSQAARGTPPRPQANVPAPSRPAPAASVQPAAQRNPAPRDPIADLINGVDMRPPGEIRGGAARPATPRRTTDN